MLDYIRDKAFSVAGEIIDNMDRIETAYNNVIKLAKVSRKEGILALEFNAGFVKDTRELADDLSWMIYLITDGTEARIIEEFVTNRFLASNYTGIDALIFYLYARGTLYIQEGMSPFMIEGFFNSVIPESVNRQRVGGAYFNKENDIYAENNRCRLAIIQERMSDETREMLDKVQALMSTMTEPEWNYMTDCDGAAGWEWIVLAVDDVCRIMIDAHMVMGRFLGYLRNIQIPKENEILEACVDFDIKLRNFRSNSKKQEIRESSTFFSKMITEEESVITAVLNEAGDNDLAVALKGCDISLRNEVLKYTEKKRKFMIKDEMGFMGPVKISDVENAVLVLESIYQKIKEERY